MASENAIYKALNMRKGEGVTIMLLMLYSFFMGSSIAFFYTASTSLLLVNFESSILPYAYIGGGVIAYLFWLLYSAAQKKFRFSTILTLGILFLIVSVAVMSFGHSFTNNKWLTFLMFIWIRIFMFISYVGFWGTASRIFNLRQGKRLFGLISSGEVISDIVGFFSIPLLLNFMNTNDILTISIIGLLICLVFISIIIKKFRKELSIKANGNGKKSGKNDELTDVFLNKKYYMLVSIMAVLPMFGICFADYIFLNQTQVQYTNADVLTSFLGLFFGVIAIAEFIVRTFISGRLISKYGIKVGLATMPILMAVSVSMAAFAGSFYGVSVSFFSFVLLTKLLERVLRTSTYDPSFQILYQPLSPENRLQFQSRIEGISKAGGNVLAGLVLVLFTNIHALTSIHFNYLFLVIILVWIRYSFKMYQEYRVTLKNLVSHQKNLLMGLIEKKNGNGSLNKHLMNANPDSFNLLLSLIEKFEPESVEPTIRELLKNGSTGIRRKILEKIENNEIIIQHKYIKRCITGSESAELRGRFERVIKHMKDIEDTPFDVLTKLAKSRNSDERAFAAKLLSLSGRYNSFKLLAELVHDEDESVKKAAIVASGKIKRHELWALIIDNLDSSVYNNAAAFAIRLIGLPILRELDLHFSRLSTDKLTKIQIIRLLASIGGKEAVSLLKEKLSYPDSDIRDEVIYSLNKLEYQARSMEQPWIKELIDEEIEIAVWIMAAIIDIGKEPVTEELHRALEFELSEKKKHIFFLLSMIYDPETIKHILENIEIGGNDSRVYALELIDLIVSTEIKEKLLILYDDVSYAECVSNFREHFPQQRLHKSERLNDIINKSYAKINIWTKTCALKIISKFENPEMINVFSSNFINPEPIICETACLEFYHYNKDKFFEKMQETGNHEKDVIQYIVNKYEDYGAEYLTIYQKVKMLKRVELLSEIPEYYLIDLADKSVNLFFHLGEKLSSRIKLDEYSFVILEGSVELIYKNEVSGYYGEGEMLLNLKNGRDNGNGMIFNAVSNVSILLMNFDVLDDFNLRAENFHLTNQLISILNSQYSKKINPHEEDAEILAV